VMTSLASHETDPGIMRIGGRHQTVSKGSKRTFIKRENVRDMKLPLFSQAGNPTISQPMRPETGFSI